MSRPFAIYQNALDDNELGYWRFGERGGRLTPVGASMTFVNNGAEAGQDGYRFVRAESDYMDAAFLGQPERGECTFECWVRNLDTSAGLPQCIAYWWKDADNRLRIFAWTADLRVSVNAEGVTTDAIWDDADAVAALLASPKAWHLAGTFDGTTLRLFVNGEQKDSSVIAGAPKALASGDYTLRLGRSYPGTTYYLSAVIDEVRLSKVARYAANFPVTRFGEGRRAVTRGPETRAGLFAGVIR